MNASTPPESPSNYGDAALSPCSPSFYGVYLGSPDGDGESSIHVYSDKLDALKIAKKCKKSRFKVFYSFEEAENFALNGPEPVCSPGTPIPAERASPFKAPISQDLVKFRKLIEKGDLDEVKRIVSNNPRYLVSSGDTPAILQEGARYNALHIAAKFNQPKICDYILRCITDPEFILKLYGEDMIKDTVMQRCDMLLDLYLNTPDKGANDTPLHFASKIGALDVIKVLISYNNCDKTRRNKQDLTALDVVATRMSIISLEEKNEIVRLLDSEYYIAVFRPLDPVRPPVLEGPFLMTSPSKPDLNSRLDSEMRMSGVAGPMKYEEAINFKKMWKRSRAFPPSSPCSPSPLSAFSPSSFKKPDKVIERIGREISSELGVYWVEYWPFLKDFANFHKENDILMLEKYFSQKYNSQNKNVDKIEELCSEFENLCTIAKENVDSKNNNEKPFKILSITKENIDTSNINKVRNDLNSNQLNSSYLHIDKTCQVYANTVVKALVSIDYQCFLTCLSRVHILIISCLMDKRYASIEFNRIHSKLAALVRQTIYQCNESNIDCCCQFLKMFLEKEGFSLNPSMLCLCEKIYVFLHDKSNEHVHLSTDDRRFSKNANEENIEMSWLHLEPCPCLTNMKNKSSKKRLDFWSRFRENDDSNLLSERMVPSSSKTDNILEKKMFEKSVNSEKNDSYDSDCFETPPGSPSRYLYNHSSDEESSDSEMYSADEGNPISIDGCNLTDVDKAVYEAVDKRKVLQSKHPYTYLWLQECHTKFPSYPSTPSICSPLSPLYRSYNENMKPRYLFDSPLSSK